ncbi:efflux RND transporter periplasmic adaptor subunit [Kangiella sp. HZ709]|uniref:efflux RND transporter periplasmic adaptor subunit n=1 Tax=Kangiella sp. HZ709 TaxID=2666328 RepID=UPI0012B07683|nr:efflux RND transporter periplasmic adaptor subunit [Kangiella sp. HZ709]
MKKILLLTLAITSMMITGCTEDGSDNLLNEEMIRPIKFHTVVKSDSSVEREYPATIKAAESSDLAFEVGGKLIALSVKESEEVSKGDVLARLDTRNAKNQMNALKSQYNNAQTEYERALKLLKEDAIAKTVVDQRKTQLDVLKNQLDTANKSLSDSVLKAPFDGVIATTFVENLENIQPQQKILTLIGKNRLEAEINVPASVVTQIPKREAESSYIIFDSEPNRRIDTEFVKANLVADSATQTYQVTFGFKNPTDILILPGMNATLVIDTTLKSQVTSGSFVSVPLTAIQSIEGINYVWVIDPLQLTVEKKEVTVEQSVGSSVKVSKGLQEGQIIAATGLSHLSKGMKVKEWKSN